MKLLSLNPTKLVEIFILVDETMGVVVFSDRKPTINDCYNNHKEIVLYK